MEYGSEWAYNDIDVGLLESMLSKPNINIIILFQKKSIHTLENKVLMHQCAIAQRISTYTLNFDIWGLNIH